MLGRPWRMCAQSEGLNMNSFATFLQRTVIHPKVWKFFVFIVFVFAVFVVFIVVVIVQDFS